MRKAMQGAHHHVCKYLLSILSGKDAVENRGRNVCSYINSRDMIVLKVKANLRRGQIPSLDGPKQFRWDWDGIR